MADTVAGKRIVEFSETSAIGSGDFIAVDNANQDTKKYDATQLATKNYADNAVSDAIDNLTIPTAKIEDGAVTNDKLAVNAVSASRIAANSVHDTHIVDSAVTESKINNGAVTTAKIADGAVNTDKLGAGAVTTAKMALFAIGASQLASNAVTEAKIANNAVSTNKIVNGAVTHDKLDSDAVMTANIVNGSVTTAKINDSAVTTGKINDSAVTEGKIANSAVKTAKINDSAVTTAKINDSAVTTAKINNGAVTTDKLASSAVTEGKIGSGAVTEGKIGSGAVSTAKLADSAVTEDKLASSSVSESKIINGAVTESKLGEDVAEILDNKAEINGYYDEMSVGSAEQLLSNTYIPDNTPYLFRTSGGSLEIGDRVYEDAIVGGSVAWNQMVNVKTTEQSGITASIDSDGVIELSGTASRSYANIFGSRKPIVGHKYAFITKLIADPNNVCSNVYANFLGSNTGNVNAHLGTSKIINIYSVSSNSFGIAGFASETNLTGVKFKIITTDLTLMFGSTIADYIYTLETSEAGSGIAWLKSQGFFTKDYYAYDAGSIKSVQTSAKKTVGFNQWDEQWEVGTFDTNTGEKKTAQSYWRSKNPIKVSPNTVYYASTSGDRIYCFYYDKGGNFIDAQPNLFTTPNNAYYLNIVDVTRNAYDSETKPVCINLHWDGERDGEYEPYVEHIYPLDSDLELRGIPKLDSSNKLYYDGDTYASDGTVTRRYGIVDLGELDWTAQAGNVFRCSVSDIKQSANTILVLSTSIYTRRTDIYTDWTDVDKVYGTRVNYDRVYFKNTAYSDVATFKTAMSGQYLVYELATPTTESADPYTNPQIVSNWGTEEFVDERDVPVPVGHDSRYLPDLKAKLESAPNNPSTNGKYFLQYENGQATYVPVPSEVPQAPSEDGTYILKATVSSGTATLAWVAEE